MYFGLEPPLLTGFCFMYSEQDRLLLLMCKSFSFNHIENGSNLCLAFLQNSRAGMLSTTNKLNQGN